MLNLPLPPVLRAMQRQGYAVFKGEDNVNLWGIRMDVDRPEDLPKIDDKWNDLIGCSWQDKRGYWHERVYSGTTDPGVKYLTRPVNSAGTAVLIPDQYRGAYILGEHKGRPALVQQGRNPVSCWRLDRDGLRERGTWTAVANPGPADLVSKPWATDTGWFALNIHDGVGAGDLIGPWSAGCQVIPGTTKHRQGSGEDDPPQLDRILEVCTRSARRYGKYFTYTLLTEGQVFGTPAVNTATNGD